MSFIQLENISKHYEMGGERIKALDGITLQIVQGEFVAVIGPSGSGKSTFMNIVGCLDTPDSGVYKLDGEDVSRLRGDRLAEIRNRKIGFVFQQFNLIPRLNAYENVELPLIYRGIAKKDREAAVATMLEMVELTDRRKHRPSELSGGQQQRVAIARALAGNPPLILADEPTGALDSGTGLEIIRMLKALQTRGKTIVIITHDASVARHAGRIIRIQDGQIVES